VSIKDHQKCGEDNTELIQIWKIKLNAVPVVPTNPQDSQTNEYT
jgi:hypothetical protein